MSSKVKKKCGWTHTKLKATLHESVDVVPPKSVAGQNVQHVCCANTNESGIIVTAVAKKFQAKNCHSYVCVCVYVPLANTLEQKNCSIYSTTSVRHLAADPQYISKLFFISIKNREK